MEMYSKWIVVKELGKGGQGTVYLAHTPAWLVATSCLEVGVNFDADHMVCTLAAMERMIQRLGRVNRFGNGDAQAVVVLDGNEIDPILQATIEALTHLPAVGRQRYDASPHALIRLKQESPDL